MRYIKQFFVILLFTFLGELLRGLLPFPVPASIYGLLLLFAALFFGVLKVEAVRETGKFLIEIMPLMFIPAAVGLIDAWPSLKPVLVPVAVIMAVSTVVVMAASGLITQYIMQRKVQRTLRGNKKNGGEENG